MFDQSLASASNFIVGVVIARLAGPSGLGAYAVAYSLWLVLAAIHRSVVTDPMAIDNDARRPDSASHLRAGIAAELSMGVLVAVVMAAASIAVIALGMGDVGIALLTLAPFVPFLLLQDYWRWAGFLQSRPGRALANDAVFNIVQGLVLVALIVAGYRNFSIAIVAWGVGALAGAVFGLRQFRIRVQARGGYAMVSSRWHISRWLLANSVSGWAASQSYPFIAGPFVGADGLGGLKAAQSLVTGPAIVLLQAGGSVGLPEASHALERDGLPGLRRIARWVTVGSSLAVGFVAVVVLFAAPQLLHWVYGAEFVPYANTARIIAWAWVLNAMATGSIIVLKVTKNTRALFNVGMVLMVVLIGGILGLSGPLGVNGTAWAMLASWALGFVLFGRARALALRAYVSDQPAGTDGPTRSVHPSDRVPSGRR